MYPLLVSVQPFEDPDDVDFVQPDEVLVDEELDAVELMWMERNARPFVPTPQYPMRALRCTAVTRRGPRAGKRCGREATLGTTVCVVHGANLPHVKKAAAARRQEIVLRMVGMTPDAVETMEDLMHNSASDAVRLKAATEILDRAGVRGGTEIDVKVSNEQSPADMLRSKLEELRKRTAPVTIDGEVVEDVTVVEEASPPLELEENTDGDTGSDHA